MVVVVFGIPGAGKSSVVKEVVANSDFKRIYWGGIVGDIAKERELIEDIDQLRKTDTEIQRELQKLTADKILGIIEAEPDHNYIIETHAAMKSREGYFTGFTPEILEMLPIDKFIVIEASAQNIHKRREADESRDRSDDSSLTEIQTHLDVTRQLAVSYSVIAMADLLLVENQEGDLDYAVNEITSLITTE